MNFVSCVKWVKQGVGKSVPDVISLNEEELKNLIDSVQDEESNHATNAGTPLDSMSGDEYDFATYDTEDGALRASIKDIVTFDENPKKQKGKKKKKSRSNIDEDSDGEDEVIKDNDNLILVGQVDDDFNSLNVYVYNEDDGDMYIHHDFVLKSAPMCVEWLSADESDHTNYCAIGEIDPVIGIWDLDIVNCIEPVFKLGRAKKKNPDKNFGHTDSVLSLAWNTELPHILCSGSVDKRSLLWDLHNGKVATELTVFTNKIQKVLWNTHNPYSLLTGCADGYLRNFDCRVYDQFLTWKLDAGIECILCQPDNEYRCFIATEDGKIHHLDYRKKKPIYSFQAHDKEVTGLSVDSRKPNILMSISADETMKFWNLEDEFNLMHSKNPKIGSLYCIDMNPNYPFLACVGGSHENRNKKILQVLNINEFLEPKFDPVTKTHIVTNTDGNSFEVPLLEENDKVEKVKSKVSKKRNNSNPGIKKKKKTKERMVN